MTKTEYNQELDSLYIYSGLKEAVIGSIIAGDLIFDIGQSGKLVGVEIENASELFKLNPTKFKDIQKASVKVEKRGNMALLMFNFQLAPNIIINHSYWLNKPELLNSQTISS